jgi:hypothetical protein
MIHKVILYDNDTTLRVTVVPSIPARKYQKILTYSFRRLTFVLALHPYRQDRVQSVHVDLTTINTSSTIYIAKRLFGAGLSSVF